MYAVQDGYVAAVVVPGGTLHVAARLRILEDVDRVVLLAGIAVVAVVVVEDQHLRLQAGGSESRADGPFDEIALFLP